jgi:hypothetical protein
MKNAILSGFLVFQPISSGHHLFFLGALPSFRIIPRNSPKTLEISEFSSGFRPDGALSA